MLGCKFANAELTSQVDDHMSIILDMANDLVFIWAIIILICVALNIVVQLWWGDAEKL